MCGIAGVCHLDGKPVDQSLLVKLTRSLRHRGPDDEGFLLADTRTGLTEHRRGSETIPEVRSREIDESFSGTSPNLGLGWRRLSIIDLSPSGHQPMSNADGTLWVIFNGEIYNYIELRVELKAKGYVFRTQSDTEVILHAYHAWGQDCLHHFNGMWGMAIWDVQKRQLFCARDRFGVKPFYYFWNGSSFAFASEIKALLELPWIPRRANDSAVYDFLVHRVLDHTEQTFFSDILQLRPGHCAFISERGLQVQRYYTLSYNPDLGHFNERDSIAHADQLRVLLNDAVRLRLRSDVTLGSCLSGGLDSSTIVSIANSLLFKQGLANRETIGERQKTFTATYDIEQYSEDRFVRQVIEQTNAQPYFVKPAAAELQNELSDFIRSNDEPSISTSMYAQWCVMRLAAQHGIKVLLDGQGADELLAGYRPQHFPVFHAELIRAGRIFEAIKEMRTGASVAGESFSGWLRAAAMKSVKSYVPKRLRHRFMTSAQLLNPAFAAKTVSHVTKEDRSIQRRLYEDETLYNLPQLLHYEDRNSMRFSVEARVPFVDYRVVEFVMNLPAVYKIHNGWSKYVLRQATNGLIPQAVQWRKDKMGFVTPEVEWMSELSPLIRKTFTETSLRSRQYVNPRFVMEQVSNRTISTGDIWRVFNLELWMREFNIQ